LGHYRLSDAFWSFVLLRREASLQDNVIADCEREHGVPHHHLRPFVSFCWSLALILVVFWWLEFVENRMGFFFVFFLEDGRRTVS
jgi:hypothetical protein